MELNNPFYRLPAAETFAAWRRRVPPGFVFAAKASRFLTHMKKLVDPAEPLALLLERARSLGDAPGPLLFQLPAAFHANVDRLDAFLAELDLRLATGAPASRSDIPRGWTRRSSAGSTRRGSVCAWPTGAISR